MKPVIMSKELIRQLGALSQDVAADCKSFSSAEVAEVCMDASRLTFSGYPELDEEVIRLVKEHGWAKVVEEGAKHVSVW